MCNSIVVGFIFGCVYVLLCTFLLLFFPVLVFYFDHVFNKDAPEFPILV